MSNPGRIPRQIGYLLVLIYALGLHPAQAWENPFKRDIAREGNAAYQAEDYSKAAQEYVKAQDLEPLSAELHLNLGSAYYRQEEYDRALEEFEKATLADDAALAAGAYYNRGNARYQASKREFEAASVAGATATAESPVQQYVGKLEQCIEDYQETLKRTPADNDAKYNIEMIRREIKNLMRRDPNQQQQQQDQQQQNQEKSEQEQEQQQQQNQQQQDQQNQSDQQKSDQEQQESEQQQDKQQQDQQQSEPQEGEQGSPTPQPMAEGMTPTPSGDESGQDQQEASAEPTQELSISEEMARNLLDNLPETRPRVRRQQRSGSDKDW